MQRVSSERMLYLGVMAPLVLAIVVLLTVCVGGFGVLSAVRAYVGGESLWSKARANAVAQLRAHAVTGQPADYRRFLEALAVPLGDREARIELEKRHPDLDVVRHGFLAGENVDEDIPGMIRLYRHFRHVEFMEEAVDAWAEGDRLIEQLRELGERIHSQVGQPQAQASLARALVELETLDGRLINVEKYFSATLGRASRKTGELLELATLALALLLVVSGAHFARKVLRVQLADRQLLIETNQRFDLAADAAGIGLFDWHVAQDRIELDERACKLFGVEWQPEHCSFKRAELRALTHPDDQSLVRGDLDAAVATGSIMRIRFRMMLPGGDLRHIEAIGRVRDAERHEQARMVGVLRDVGSEVRENQLLLEKESAERVARLRVEFLSRLSHELRTPLNAVLGVAQLLRIDAREPLSVNQAKRVKMLEDSGTHLLQLVEDVLDITGVDTGVMKLDLVPVDILGALRASLSIVEPERAAFEVRIDDQMPFKQAFVLADADRLQQVFVNLLSNACKYNRRGGRLWLQYGEDVHSCWLRIGDEGSGMTQAQLGQLFQPFKRMAARQDVSGTGLGLVVAKVLTEQMSGRISVESEAGKGSVFTVRMLRAPQEEEAVASSDVRDEHAG